MALAAYVAEDCPSWSSMGGEAFGPVKVLCLSIGECVAQYVVGGGFRSWARGAWIGYCGGEGRLGKGITFEM